MQVLEKRQQMMNDVTVATQATRKQEERSDSTILFSRCLRDHQNSIIIRHQIKFAIKLMPVFEGKEEENIL